MWPSKSPSELVSVGSFSSNRLAMELVPWTSDISDMSEENFFLDPELHKGWAEGSGDLFSLSLTIAQESAFSSMALPKKHTFCSVSAWLRVTVRRQKACCYLRARILTRRKRKHYHDIVGKLSFCLLTFYCSFLRCAMLLHSCMM